MLINPTIDMLRELGLSGMACAFQNWRRNRRHELSSTANGLPSCLNGRRRRAGRSASRPEREPPDSVMTPRSRTPISAQLAVSIAISSRS